VSTPENELPPLKEGYEDEFGPIDPQVYQAAREIWPKAVTFGEFSLRDRSLVFNLMMKAAANVSRSMATGRIQYLHAYLLKTFKRLVVEEREKRLPRSEALSEVPDAVTSVVADLDRKILLREIFAHLNHVDREVVELWMIGHSYERIAQILNLKPHTVGKRINRLVSRLRKTFADDETHNE
jgi:DNA-directed RNA polymerase specialized sigma24 family protein